MSKRCPLCVTTVRTVPHEGDNFTNSKMDHFSLIHWLIELIKKWLSVFFMSMLNREVYIKVTKKLLKLKQPCRETHRPSTKCKALCVCVCVWVCVCVCVCQCVTYSQVDLFCNFASFLTLRSPSSSERSQGDGGSDREGLYAKLGHRSSELVWRICIVKLADLEFEIGVFGFSVT